MRYIKEFGYAKRANAPHWLDVDWLLSQFGKQRDSAIEAYCKFFLEGQGLPSPLD